MNNDTNNNMQGTVLGSVNPQPTPQPQAQPVPNNTINVGGIPSTNPGVENLNVNPAPTSEVVNPQPAPQTQPQAMETPTPEQGRVQVEGVKENVIIEPTPQQTSPNAFTNPASINPNPVPGFDNPNVVGTTPPISLEQEKEPKKKGGKGLFIVILVVLIAAIGFGTYYILNYTNLLKKNDKVKVTVKEVEVQLNGELATDIDTFATIEGTDKRNCSLDTKEVDVTKAGKYKFSVTCGETLKTGIVSVVDNADLEVELKTVYKVKGDTLEASAFAAEENENITYEFVDKTVVDEALASESGTYTVKIKATDNTSGKTIEKNATLIIVAYKIKGFLVCESESSEVNGVPATVKVKTRLGIQDDGNNGFAGIATEVQTFTFSDEEEYRKVQDKYIAEGSISINEVSGPASFDDDTLTVTITNSLTNDILVGRYGEEAIKNYSSIKSYYTGTLNYSCIYEISND